MQFLHFRSPLKPDSDRPVTGGKRKSDELVNNWSMKNLSDMFRSFDDGDNDSDFDMDMPTGRWELMCLNYLY